MKNRARESEARGQLILVWEVDPSTLSLVELSGGGQSLLGYPLSRLSGVEEGWLALVAQEDRGRAREALSACAEGGGFRSEELRMVDAAGRTLVMYVEIRRFEREERERIQVAAIDITTWRRTHRELEALASLNRATLESTADGILIVDRAGRMISFNQAFVDLWQVPRELLDARDDAAALDSVLDQLREPERFLRKVRELYENPEASSFDVLEFRDGRVVERYSQPQKMNQEIAGRVWSFRDVTEARRVQRQRDELLREAQDGLRHRDEFLSVVAHELRTPLTSVLLALQTLNRMVGRGQEALLERFDVVERALTTSVRQVKRLGRLVDDLLDLGRVDSGLDLRPAEIDLAEVVVEAAGEMRETLDRAGCTLVVEADEQVIGWWDGARIAQVVTNLLSNVARHAAGSKVRVEVAREQSFGRFMVADSGPGIDDRVRPHLFERYGRVRSRDRAVGGMGIGLHIVKQIVLAHGGNISAESLPGQGTTFVIELPLRIEAC